MFGEVGKRLGEKVSKASTPPEPTLASCAPLDLRSGNATKIDKSPELPPVNLCRWWDKLTKQVGIVGFRIQSLFDSGATRTAIGPVGIQIATACGQPITPYKNPGAKLANGQLALIYGYVDLPFDVL